MLGLHATLLQHGMVTVGLPYEPSRRVGLDEMNGASPYGATTVAGSRGECVPSDQEIDVARRQGAHLATITRRMRG